MKNSTFISVFLFALSLSVGDAQVVVVNCNYVNLNSRYTCLLNAVTIPDNEDANVFIWGQHLPTRTNADVTAVFIENSNIPFVIRQFFTTFVNLQDFRISNGGLTRVQEEAFANAENLVSIDIRRNDELKEIVDHAFKGAENVVSLTLASNRIKKIHEAAFEGLDSLIALSLEFNVIEDINVGAFKPLKALRILTVWNNLLKSLDGGLLAHNPAIHTLDFSFNKINAIEKTFFDELPALDIFNMLGNDCADNLWFLRGETTIETLLEELEKCFENFVSPPDDEVRNFILELRGHLTVLDEEGNEIVSI